MRVLWLAGCLLMACDPLAGRDYVGEPLFTLVGTFDATASAPDDPLAGIALMWQDPAGAGGPGIAVTDVPVAIAFPATFRVEIPLPPPDAARFTLADGEPALAEAYVYVVSDTSSPVPAARGLDRAHVLIYASAAVAAGTLAADYLGGPVAAGYHLRRFVPATAPGAAQRAMIDRCAASGAERTACEVRRAYQLAPAGDADPLRITVAAP